MNTLDRLLFDLQTLSDIPRGRRISTAKEFIIIEDASLMQGLWRRVSAESRDKAVVTICREVRSTIFIAQLIMESYLVHRDEDNQFMDLSTAGENNRRTRLKELKKINAGLIGANRGINTLCETYDSDADVSGRLVPLIGNIAECCKHISELLSECKR